ncbi:hypothetical protein E2C01_050619 [Portunus trituberculatus]|uniref:Uncharacterized protein n=1 Tax=Portunus trituberculatus TaxID=210409 RepID=A0A5B7GJH5_PORTR|nr:hypothetical protein [Portunus trituberculatus]
MCGAVRGSAERRTGCSSQRAPAHWRGWAGRGVSRQGQHYLSCRSLEPPSPRCTSVPGESSLTRFFRVTTFINLHKLRLPTSTLLQLQHLTYLEAIRRLKKSKYSRCYCVD